jgi:hypothetical protein
MLRDIQLDLFYLDSSNNIMQATHSNTKGSATVSLLETQVIQSGTNVNPSSSLAAIYMDATWGWRVYYQTTGGAIEELVGANGWSTGNGGVALGTGIKGTAITVSMISSPDLNLFYIDAFADTLYFTAYTSGWSIGLCLLPCFRIIYELTNESNPIYVSKNLHLVWEL